jgi:uncharacterized delta-60 repeat protein
MQRFSLPRAVCLFVFCSFTVAGAVNVRAQSIDAFNPLPDGSAVAIAIQADGKIVIASQIQNVNNTPVSDIARLNVDGSLDNSFQGAGAVNGEIIAVAVQPDAKLLVGGSFDAIGGGAHHYLARLNANGTLDSGFADPSLDSTVWSIAVQPDGKILAAGDFTVAGSTARAHLARFNTNGTLDTSFADPQICSTRASTVALQSTGEVLVGGYFAYIGNCSGTHSSPYHSYLARFSSAGVLDSAFPIDPPGSAVTAIVVGPDDALIVNGGYSVPAGGLRLAAKLSANGTFVPAYGNLSNDGSTNSFVLQPDGKLLLAGDFQTIAAQPRHGLARLNADGTLDTGFADLHFSISNTNPNGTIFGIAAQRNGEVIAVGNFSLVNGQARQFAARVTLSDQAISRLSGSASGGSVIVTWTRSGAGSELAQPPTLLHSTDGANFAAVGTMTRVAGGWRIIAPYNIAGTPFYLRAEGYVSSGAGNGSSGRVQSPVYVSDRIFADGFE